MNQKSARNASAVTRPLGVLTMAVAAAFAALLLFSSPASAQYVSPTTAVRGPVDTGASTPSSVLGTSVDRNDGSGTLPFTGGEVVGMAVVGGIAVAVGVGLTVATRRRQHTA